VGSDGNCLFRAIAFQAYGDEDQHRLVRIKCMNYIKAEKTYFSNYIEGGLDNIDEYTTKKSCNGVWGDDLEL
jgi:OTU domain-containing protein 5